MPNSDEPNDMLRDTGVLRLMIRDAVEREIINITAPLRQQLQITDGILKQLNRDYGALTRDLDELNSVVRGDPELGITGLMSTVRSMNDQLKASEKKLNDLSVYIRVGFAIVISLGLIDNERVASFFVAIVRAAGL